MTERSQSSADVDVELLASALSPVRSHLHSFLSDVDAVRLMRVSSSFTGAVLTDYTFDHQIQLEWPSSAALARLIGLYDRYRMRVTRLAIHKDYRSSLVDEVTGQSLLPSSLIDLQVGELHEPDGDDESTYLCDLVDEDERAKDSVDQRVELYRRRMNALYLIHYQGWVWSKMNQPLVPGALPPNLQSLRLGSEFNHPLVVGVLPSSLTRLVLGRDFDQPLLEGQLSSSLTHIAFSQDSEFDQPLLPGVLPPSLRELELGWAFNQPLWRGCLPAGLRRLTLSVNYNQPIPPGVLPPSLTHLHFGERYNRPLEVGSLPSGLVQLYIGERFDHPLTAGVLPSSLRELLFVSWAKMGGVDASSRFDQPILPGQLPDGLESLVLPRKYRHEVGVGVLPDGLLALDLGLLYFSRLFAQELGREVLLDVVLPRGLRWLKIRERDHGRVEDELPPTVQCCWHE